MNYFQHQQMNACMCEEISDNFNYVKTVTLEYMSCKEHYLLSSFSEYSIYSQNIKKMCDYVHIFHMVNSELINGDLDKKRRKKKTRRYKIKPLFLEATDCLTLIYKLLKEIKV